VTVFDRGRGTAGPHAERSEGIVKEALGKARPVAVWALTAVVAFAALSALINLLFIDNRAGEFGFENSAARAFQPGDGVIAAIVAGLALVLIAHAPAINAEARAAVVVIGLSIGVLVVVGVISFFSGFVADFPSGLYQTLYLIGQLVALGLLAAAGLAVVHAARSADMARPRPAAPQYAAYGQMYGQAPYGYGGQPYRQPAQPGQGQYGGPYAPPPGQYPGQPPQQPYGAPPQGQPYQGQPYQGQPHQGQPHQGQPSHQPAAPYGGHPAQPTHSPYGQPAQPGQPPHPYGSSYGQPIRPQPFEQQPYPAPPFTQPNQPPSYPREPEGGPVEDAETSANDESGAESIIEPDEHSEHEESERPPV
jgi:hypothetical protein